MWTGPAIASFIIALVALAASLTALGWQFYTWRRTGPRLAVSANQAIGVGSLSDMDLISVTIVNSGRAATIAQEFALELPNKHKFITANSPNRLKLPAELPPGGELTYYFERANLVAQLDQIPGLDRSTPLRGFVRTGHGVVYAKKTISVG